MYEYSWGQFIARTIGSKVYNFSRGGMTAKEYCEGFGEQKDLWNEKYKEYLGVEPENDAEGILQDIHWATGDFGYFPSYALGSAVAAQIYYYMKGIMPFEDYLKEMESEI